MNSVEKSCLNWADRQLIALSAILSRAVLSEAVSLEAVSLETDALASSVDQPLSQAQLGSSVSKSQIQQLSPGALAYVGDAVYELYVRTRYLFPAKRLQAYHQQVVAQVRAESQADYLALLHPQLTKAEQDVVRRGRNAAAKGPKRVDPEIYQQATGLETLFGYLYLSDPQRLLNLLQQLQLGDKEIG